MKNFGQKELPYERILFFTDAIVAIAITLMAFNLKVEVRIDHHLRFADILAPWRSYLAFILSFINIASFWRTHHLMFGYIKKMDSMLISINFLWVFSVVTLPFTTALVSAHFDDTPAIFLYSFNLFLLAIFQSLIWGYANKKTDFVPREQLSLNEESRFHLLINLDMVNGFVAIILSFINPIIAFIILFFKIPVFVLSMIYIAQKKIMPGKPKT